MVGPAAAARALTTRASAAASRSPSALALVETWAGIALAYATDWPATFWIVLFTCAVYFLALARPMRIAHAHEAHGA